MEEINESAIKELREKDALFNVIYEEHAFLNERIDDYIEYSVNEDINNIIKNLKKLKLLGKDRMIKIAREHGYL